MSDEPKKQFENMSEGVCSDRYAGSTDVFGKVPLPPPHLELTGSSYARRSFGLFVGLQASKISGPVVVYVDLF